MGASSSPCSDTFCGYSPESEIEVRNVADFIRRNKSNIKAYLTIHSYSQLLLFPYSYTYKLAATHSELVSPTLVWVTDHSTYHSDIVLSTVSGTSEDSSVESKSGIQVQTVFQNVGSESKSRDSSQSPTLQIPHINSTHHSPPRSFQNGSYPKETISC